MPILIVIFVLVFLGAAVAVGAYGARRTDPPAPGGNQSDLACKDACEQLQTRRSDVCRAAADARAATLAADRAAAFHTGTAVALLAATALAAALWASTLIPVFGLAAVPFAVAATAAAVAATLAEALALGAMIGAQAAAETSVANEARARSLEQDAVAQLRATCGPEASDACLARPRPC